jgi:hypothetical protein
VLVTGSKGDEYRVTRDKHSHKNRSVQHDWSCTCMGYQTRGKCKHIGKVQSQKLRCGWMQFTDGGERTTEGKCPNCNVETDSMGWAV